MTQGKVVGKRLGFWRGTSPVLLAFIFGVCPLCLILSVRCFVGLRHLAFGEIADDHFLQVGASVIGILMFPFGMWLLSDARRAYTVVSACPACGVEHTREFRDPREKFPWPTACGHCFAYLRVRPGKLVVCEIPLDEPTTQLSHYGIETRQYIDIVPRREDAEDRPFAFVMPQMCAVCCAPNAPYLTEIGTLRDVAGKGALRGIAYPMNYAGKTSAPPKDDLDDANGHIQPPVCTAHKTGIAMLRDGGYLCFITYRYYRAFCELNKLAPPGATPA